MGATRTRRLRADRVRRVIAVGRRRTSVFLDRSIVTTELRMTQVLSDGTLVLGLFDDQLTMMTRCP